MYKLGKPIYVEERSTCVIKDGKAAIPFDPANTDYQRFKTEIEAGEAELQDSEGVTMSPEEAKAFVKELP